MLGSFATVSWGTATMKALIHSFIIFDVILFIHYSICYLYLD